MAALTSRELMEWQAFFQIQPFGQDITDFLLAQLTAFYANSHRRKGQAAYKIDEFLPYHKPRRMTADQIKSTLRNVLYGNRRNT